MINKKVSTVAGSLIITAIVIAIGFVFLSSKEEVQIQNNVVLNNSGLGNKEEVKQENEKINTSDWKICRNEKNGYEFKYPRTWRLGAPVNRDINDCNDQIGKESLAMWSSIPGEMEKATFSINSNDSSREDFISQNKAEINIVKELEIDENPALIYTKNGPRGEINFIVIFKNGASYGLTASELSSDATFDALVVNFKLLN
jgi:hypothetical protein